MAPQKCKILRRAHTQINTAFYLTIIIQSRSTDLHLTLYLNGEKLISFPLRSDTRQEDTLLPFLFYIILEVLAKSIEKKRRERKRKEKKMYIDWEEKVKLPFFTDDMSFYVENPKEQQQQ